MYKNIQYLLFFKNLFLFLKMASKVLRVTTTEANVTLLLSLDLVWVMHSNVYDVAADRYL